jgi:hypothetical protein
MNIKTKIKIHKTIDVVFILIQFPRWLPVCMVAILLCLLEKLGDKSRDTIDFLHEHRYLWVTHRKIRVWLGDDREFIPKDEEPAADVLSPSNYVRHINGQWSRPKTAKPKK